MKLAPILLLTLALSACAERPGPADPHLGEADRLRLEAATQRALRESGDGEATPWRNAEGAAAGAVVPFRTFLSYEGFVCREFRQTAAAGGTILAAYGTACRAKSGAWRRVRYSELAPNGSQDALLHYRMPRMPGAPTIRSAPIF